MIAIFSGVDEKPKSTKQILLERTKPPKCEQGKAYYEIKFQPGHVKPVFVNCWNFSFVEKESEYFSKPGGKWEGLPTNELVLTPPDKLTNILL